MLDIHNIITDNTNLIEIYLINKHNDNMIELNNKKELIDKILNKYKFKMLKYKSYYRNNLTYTYDLTNDNQYVNEKNLENYKINDNIAYISYNEFKYPPFMFGCTNNIDHKIEYTLYEYKLNNRISLIIRNENKKKCIYIQYKHSNIVDIEKIENIINSLILEFK
tara:strand:+ start:463 stop:957 length:495 start_codon:yes stop_codon:yes gene_type:complete